jgi:hypothetical protein
VRGGFLEPWRRRFEIPLGLSLEFRTLKSSKECFMRRLSFLVVENAEAELVEGVETSKAGAVTGTVGLDFRWRLSFLPGMIGAYIIRSAYHKRKLHTIKLDFVWERQVVEMWKNFFCGG